MILIREPCLTSLPHSNSYQPYPNDKLRNGDNHEPDRDRSIPHCHGVYPTTRLSAVNSEPLKNERAPNLRVNTICAKRVQRQNARIANHEVSLHLFLGNMRNLMISVDFELRFVQLGCDRHHMRLINNRQAWLCPSETHLCTNVRKEGSCFVMQWLMCHQSPRSKFGYSPTVCQT